MRVNGRALVIERESICTVEEYISGEVREELLTWKFFMEQYMRDIRRLILIDKQGMTGKKIEYHSIPYKSITHFSIETAGHLDLDAELKIWISGTPGPIEKQFNKSLNIYALQSVLASYILK